MIDKNQKVTIKWITRNKAKYEALGYHCEKLNTPLTIPLYELDENSNVHVDVQCDICGKHIITPYRNYNSIIKRKGFYCCRKCNAPSVSKIRIENNKRRQFDYFCKRINELGYTTNITVDDYHGCDAPLPFVCNKHGEQQLSINQLRQGCICPVCGEQNKNKISKTTTDEAIRIVNSKNNDVLLNPEEYVDRSTRNLRILCGSCGQEFVTNLDSIYSSSGYCPRCAIRVVSEARKHSIEDIIKMSTIDGKCCVLNPEDYSGMFNVNLKFKCIECGDIFVRSLQHWMEGDGRCRKCTGKMSIGEHKVAGILEKYNVSYQTEKRFKDCRNIKPLPFDFYLPKYNCCIEYDGYHHYHERADKQGDLEQVQYRDEIKTNYCKNNNIKLIRIPYWETKNMEKIITEKLGIVQLEDIV